MKLVRIGLLLFLAVLLPVRGVLAAAVLCPMSGVGSGTLEHAPAHSEALPSVTAGDIESAHEAQHHPGRAAAAQLGDHDAGSEHHDHGSAADKCNVCSAVCSLTPLVTSSPVIAAPDLAGEKFPALPAPVPSFLSGGQDRPPRSI